jgi:hypothetical protein
MTSLVIANRLRRRGSLRRRGMVVGILRARNATGQLIIPPYHTDFVGDFSFARNVLTPYPTSEVGDSGNNF